MTSSLYWLEQSLAVLPFMLTVYAAIGLPVALLLLPRPDWSQHSSIACLTLAMGSGILTLWMFILGSIGAAQHTPLMTLPNTLAGIGIIALFAWIALFFKRRQANTLAPAAIKTPLAFDEKLMLFCISIALLIRFITTAYWTFTAYDPLWVFAYNARLFLLDGFIPQDIAYYPQYLALQYTFAQFFSEGFDDHAARMVIPIVHIGSILAAYIAGKQLFNRRTGIFAAAIWALYPHVAEWAHAGDLEIPLTFLLTGSIVFFLKAWIAPENPFRRRYALIAGIFFGLAMWTKPTAGAFIWGVMLLVALDLWRVRFNLKKCQPRFEVALITGLACIPHGAIWYIRNAMLGHNLIDLPHHSWVGLARRSGDLFGWLLLALLLFLLYLHTRKQKPDARFTLPGVLLICAGLLPSTPFIYELFAFLPEFTRFNPPESYLQPVEWLLIIAGIVLISVSLLRYQKTARFTPEIHQHGQTIGWAYLLILPYFFTWFYSYSYHYRLVFAITPILILPIAFLLAQLVPVATLKTRKPPFKFLYILLIVCLAVPGILLSYFSVDRYDDWLWTDRYPDDWSRYGVHNPDMVLLAEQLIGNRDFTGRNPVVIAPGEQRLPFFFPELDIDNTSLPTELDTLAERGVTHFVYGKQAEWRYEDALIPPEANQIVAAMGRSNLMEQALLFDDATFRYELYQINMKRRFDNPVPEGMYAPEGGLQYGDFARLQGIVAFVGNNTLNSSRAFFEFLWESVAPTEQDYQLEIRLVHLEDEQVYHVWEHKIAQHAHGHYRTSFWQPGEQILDTFALHITDESNMRPGEYRVEYWLCLIDEDHCAPMTLGGEAIDYYANPLTWRYD